MIDGNLRSAVHGKDAALLATLEISAGQLEYLTHRGWEWMAPACVWVSEGKERDALWCIDEDEWSVSVGGLVLATHETFDMHACQHEWSTTPARDVLHIWEAAADEAIEAGELDAKHRDAPRKAIEAKEAWCRGDADDEVLRAARLAAWDAARLASSAARLAREAAWSAMAASNAARGVAREAASAAARDAAYSKYCEKFTAHVLSCLANKKHTKEQ